jgi:septal ring factor EnvC (AmiA/AmiB activator)
MLLLTLSTIAIGGCAPMLLAGGAVVGAKGYVNDTAHEEQLGRHSKTIDSNLSRVNQNAKTINSNLAKVKENSKTINKSISKVKENSKTINNSVLKVKEHAKTIDSNLLKVEENKNHIDALHEKIKMLESVVINLQKLLLDKPQPTQVIGGSDNVVR